MPSRLSTRDVILEIRRLISQHQGDEQELLEALVAESEGWEMRLDELEKEHDG